MRILLYCDFGLPDSCADATRVINLAKLLREEGHEVTLLGVQYKAGGPTEGSYDGISFEMLRAGPWKGLRAYKRIRGLERSIAAYLSSTASRPFDAVVLSGVYFHFTKHFRAYSKRHGTKLIVSALEWYDKTNVQFVGLRGKINFVKNRVALRRIFVKMKNIFAISTLLDDYYKARGCNTVTVPTIIDLKEYAGVAGAEKNFGDTVRVAYAGSPGRKDYIVNAIRAVEFLSEEERSRLRLDFYGAKTEQLYRLGLSPEFIKTYGENIVCHGRIPYAEVKEKIAAADFTVLLRPDKRYANAGFPTKVGESMACGTPVIANITSDLGKYILDGKTGIVCRDETPEACAEAFRRALAMTAEERSAMRRATLEMADTAFNYRAYAEDIEAFLKSCI